MALKNVEQAAQQEVVAKENEITNRNVKMDTEFVIGHIPVDLKSLPSRGMFYEDGTVILIKAATVAEIRYWSMISDDIAKIDDAINHIIERCTIVKNDRGLASYKDIKEVDRFYILLAIRELTFKSENPIKLKVSDGSTISIHKDMVEFMKIGEKIKSYFNPSSKTFDFSDVVGDVTHLTLPSIGLSMWMKNYVMEKMSAGEKYDEVFITYMPFMDIDWRVLNHKTYEDLLVESINWNLKKLSVFSKFREAFMSSISPEIVYKDSCGVEARTPLDFQGGYKSLFIISDIVDLFD